MAEILSQHVAPVPGGNVISTVVKLSAASETISNWPRLSSATGSAAQVRRAGDAATTVTVASITSITLAGTVGNECLVVSHHDSPIVQTVA